MAECPRCRAFRLGASHTPRTIAQRRWRERCPPDGAVNGAVNNRPSSLLEHIKTGAELGAFAAPWTHSSARRTVIRFRMEVPAANVAKPVERDDAVSAAVNTLQPSLLGHIATGAAEEFPITGKPSLLSHQPPLKAFEVFPLGPHHRAA